MTEGPPAARRSVFYCVNDFWACGWYRCYVPGVALKALGYRVVLDTSIHERDVAESDVIVLQTPRGADHLNVIRAVNGAGKLSVVELDDDVWSMSPSNPGHAHWSKPDVRRNLEACVKEAGLVTTPTHALAEKLRALNPRVKVLPNMLPSEGWDYPAPKAQREDRIVLGWAGSTSHGGDLRAIDGVVQPLLERYPHVECVIVGGPPSLELGEHERIRRLKPTDISGYPRLLEEFDVGLIPLADTAFNRSKSDLKFVEYARLGIPSVASKLEPYIRTVKHGENGFLASSPKDWMKHLTRLIEDVELRRRIGAAAHAHALNRHIDGAIGKWEAAYGLTRPNA